MSTFHNIDELTRCLDREKKLLNELFAKRNALSFRYDYALELTDYKEERIKYLIENEVIRESGDFLEMEDTYVQFFEEVLQINEEINVSSVQDYITHLRIVLISFGVSPFRTFRINLLYEQDAVLSV